MGTITRRTLGGDELGHLRHHSTRRTVRQHDHEGLGIRSATYSFTVIASVPFVRFAGDAEAPARQQAKRHCAMAGKTTHDHESRPPPTPRTPRTRARHLRVVPTPCPARPTRRFRPDTPTSPRAPARSPAPGRVGVPRASIGRACVPQASRAGVASTGPSIRRPALVDNSKKRVRKNVLYPASAPFTLPQLHNGTNWYCYSLVWRRAPGSPARPTCTRQVRVRVIMDRGGVMRLVC